jgi:MFS family permease
LKLQFRRDAKLLLATSGLFAISFYGLQNIIKVLYILRLGHGPGYLGLFSSTSAFTFMGMSLPSGALGDRFGRGKIMIAGGAITIIGMALLPLTESVPIHLQSLWPIASQMALTTGWSMFSVNLVPALMTVTTAENRSKAYALNSALRGLGTFIGTLIGGTLPVFFAAVFGQSLNSTAPYRTALFTGVALGLAAMLPMFLIKYRERVDREQRTAAGGKFPFLFIFLLVLHVYFSHSVWAIARVFCTAYMDADLKLTPLSIGLIIGAGQSVAVLAPFLIPLLTARRGNGWLLMATSVSMTVALIPLAMIHHWAAAGFSIMGILALSAVWLPVLQVYQMEMVESRWRSLGYGAIAMALGLSFGSLCLIGGYVATAGGYRSVFWLGIGLTIAGVLVLGALLRRERVH